MKTIHLHLQGLGAGKKQAKNNCLHPNVGYNEYKENLFCILSLKLTFKSL